jgi:hypothetical protein
VSARSRSRPWYRDPFDLGEAGAACLRGYVFALRCVPNWVAFGVELLPAARIWSVPGHGAAELRSPPALDYGFPFALSSVD